MSALFFACVAGTLKDFGLNPKHLGAQIGLTMVLHTHSRRLDFHPHIHVVVPGGGLVQPPDKIVARFARTIYPCSLADLF